MPSKTKKQLNFFRLVNACKKSDYCPSSKIKTASDSMTKNQISHFLHQESHYKSFDQWLDEKEKKDKYE
jgi:hypothetical protein